MEQMKFDCGGSAAVLGAARAIGMLEPEGVEVHFIVAACENMINQKAMVPSDILTASNGKVCRLCEWMNWIFLMHASYWNEPFSIYQLHAISRHCAFSIVFRRRLRWAIQVRLIGTHGTTLSISL